MLTWISIHRPKCNKVDLCFSKSGLFPLHLDTHFFRFSLALSDFNLIFNAAVFNNTFCLRTLNWFNFHCEMRGANNSKTLVNHKNTVIKDP